MEGNFLNLIKGIYDKHTADTILTHSIGNGTLVDKITGGGYIHFTI